MKFQIVLLCTVILLIGCVEIEQVQHQEPVQPQNTVQPPPKETGPEPQVWFCKVDNCTHQVQLLFEQAQESIHCALHELELENLIETLDHKSQNIDVNLIIDNKYKTDAIRGPELKYDDRSALMHNKFCIIDDKTIWTGSFNPTSRGNDLNANNIISIQSSLLAENYQAEFQEMWQEGLFGKGMSVPHPQIEYNGYLIENYFCPEDDCEDQVVRLIEQAQESVTFLLFSFTSKNVADALLFNTNIEIKGIQDSSQAASRYAQFPRLAEFGLNVTRDKVKGKLHHKTFIIDDSIVITGSYNPSTSGNKRNDENILIIHNEQVAEQFNQEFARLFRNGIGENAGSINS